VTPGEPDPQPGRPTDPYANEPWPGDEHPGDAGPDDDDEGEVRP